jgi:hypothetical protein
MKKFFTALLALFLAAGVFAQSNFPPLIDAALNDDYKTFSKLVKTEDLTQKTPAGLTVQLSLAYFSTKNFEKACKLLSSKGVNLDEPAAGNISLLHLLAYTVSADKIEVLLKYKPDVNRREEKQGTTPAQMTQFATYRFVTNQVIPEGTASKALAARKALEAAGSEPFKFVDRTFGNIGNFYFCFFQVVSTIYPFLKPQDLNSNDLFITTDEYGRTQAQFNFETLTYAFSELGIKNEISVFYKPEEIAMYLKYCAESSDTYFLIGQTGNSRLAPWQWVCINGCDDFNYNANSFLIVSNPDSRFENVDFQIKDLTQLITIKYTPVKDTGTELATK